MKYEVHYTCLDKECVAGPYEEGPEIAYHAEDIKGFAGITRLRVVPVETNPWCPEYS